MRNLGLLIAAIGIAVLIWAMWSEDEPFAPQKGAPTSTSPGKKLGPFTPPPLRAPSCDLSLTLLLEGTVTLIGIFRPNDLGRRVHAATVARRHVSIA